MTHARSSLRHDERGQMMPIVAMMIIVIFGFAALAVDVGSWHYQQRIEQTAADSASVAGAIELNYSRAAGAVSATARADAATNGFTDNGADVAVTVNNPPATGSFAGNTNAVEVIVAKKQPGFFTAIFGQTFQWVTVRSVTAQSVVGRGCIYTLNGDVVINGSGSISAKSCGLNTNGNLSVTSHATVDANTIGYTGTWSGGGVYPNAQPETEVAVQDPCPTILGCTYLATHPPISGACGDQNPIPSKLQPAEFCAPLQISGNVTLAPGLYVLDQGFIANGNATISGTGVTIYNKNGQFTLNGNISLSLSAPTTGTMAGIVYFQPPANSSAFTVNGRSGTDDFVGAMYLPTAALTLNGNSPNTTLLVAASITMNGGGIGASASGLPGVGHVLLGE
ncbi:MAG: pilus assembly protein TadG-related protein [Candidatus Velthaea sp.]